MMSTYQRFHPEDDPIKVVQKRIMKRVGFSPPIFHGRGIINYTFGILPFRKPITAVGKYMICLDMLKHVLNPDIYHVLLYFDIFISWTADNSY